MDTVQVRSSKSFIASLFPNKGMIEICEAFIYSLYGGINVLLKHLKRYWVSFESLCDLTQRSITITNHFDYPAKSQRKLGSRKRKTQRKDRLAMVRGTLDK